MRGCVLACLVTALLGQPFIAAGQTTLPVGADGSTIFVAPAGWVQTSGITLSQGFRAGIVGDLIAAFHPEGSRPTDLPYALIEHIDREPNLANFGVTYSLGKVVSKYTKAIDPPSKADRAGTWKAVRMTEPVVLGGEFSFRAAVEYVGGISGDQKYFVDVIGHFENEGTTVLSVWTNTDGRAAHGPAIDALIKHGLQPNRAAVIPPPMSIQERLVVLAKISGVLLIVLVAGVQLFVVWRDRRHRLADEAAFDESLG